MVILQQRHSPQWFDTCKRSSNVYLQPANDYRKCHINAQIKLRLNMTFQTTFASCLYANKGHMLIALNIVRD